MTFRKDVREISLALSLASLILSTGASALAQDQAPTPDATPTEAPTSEAPAMDTSASEAPAPEEPSVEPAPVEADTPPASDESASSPDAQSPQPPPAIEPVVASAAAPLEDSEKEPAAAHSPNEASGEAPVVDPTAERNKTVSFVGMELLPITAFPNDPVRGITNGSMWRNFQGHQIPYMPKIEDKPTLRIGVSGYIWNDLSNARIEVDESLAEANVNDQNRWTTQTRGMIRFTPTYNASNGWFAQGNAELVLSGDMTADPSTGVLATTDDLWVRAGKWNVFDVTVGRFQGWEVANHYGMGLDWGTLERSGAWIVSSSLPKPTDGYGLTYFWDRQNFLHGAYALHVYPTKYLRAELMGHVGVGNSANAATPFQTDIRPVGIFDIGWLKLKAGYEWGRSTPQDSEQKVSETKNGYGFAAQFVFAPYVEFGGSFGRGFQDVIDKDEQPDLAASNTVQTVGGFLNVSPGHPPLVFGFGAFLFSWEDLRIDNVPGPHQGKVDTNDQWLLFAAAQYTFWERLNVKFVLSHASNKVEHFRVGSYVNNAMSGRLRVELLF